MSQTSRGAEEAEEDFERVGPEMKWDLENMLRQVQEQLTDRNHTGDLGPYIAGVEQVRDHIRQVRAGTTTIDEFADLYMLRPQPTRTKAQTHAPYLAHTDTQPETRG